MDHDGADRPEDQYNDTNRAFLQAFIARGTLTLAEGKKLLAAIFTANDDKETDPKDVSKADFDSYISAAADAITLYDYEIRNTEHQITKTRYYAVVNSRSDPVTQLASTRSPEEILYIRRLLDAMFDTFNRPGKEIMAITGMQAGQGVLRKGAGRVSVGDGSQMTDKGVTNGEVEALLTRLVKEGWLEKSRAGFLSLAPRALLELRSWLVDTYNEAEPDDPDDWQRIKLCEACKEIVTVGQRCAEMECNVRLHNICEAAYFRSRPAKKCPQCNTAWKGGKFVGEKAVTTTEDYLKGKRRSGGAASKRAREEVAEEEEEEEEQPAARRKKGGRAPRTQASDEDEEEKEEQPAARRKKGGRAPQTQASDEDEEEEEESEPEQPVAHRKKGGKATQVDSDDEDAEGEDDDE